MPRFYNKVYGVENVEYVDRQPLFISQKEAEGQQW